MNGGQLMSESFGSQRAIARHELTWENRMNQNGIVSTVSVNNNKISFARPLLNVVTHLPFLFCLFLLVNATSKTLIDRSRTYRKSPRPKNSLFLQKSVLLHYPEYDGLKVVADFYNVLLSVTYVQTFCIGDFTGGQR